MPDQNITGTATISANVNLGPVAAYQTPALVQACEAELQKLKDDGLFTSPVTARLDAVNYGIKAAMKTPQSNDRQLSATAKHYSDLGVLWANAVATYWGQGEADALDCRRIEILGYAPKDAEQEVKNLQQPPQPPTPPADNTPVAVPPIDQARQRATKLVESLHQRGFCDVPARANLLAVIARTADPQALDGNLTRKLLFRTLIWNHIFQGSEPDSVARGRDNLAHCDVDAAAMCQAQPERRKILAKLLCGEFYKRLDQSTENLILDISSASADQCRQLDRRVELINFAWSALPAAERTETNRIRLVSLHDNNLEALETLGRSRLYENRLERTKMVQELLQTSSGCAKKTNDSLAVKELYWMYMSDAANGCLAAYASEEDLKQDLINAPVLPAAAELIKRVEASGLFARHQLLKEAYDIRQAAPGAQFDGLKERLDAQVYAWGLIKNGRSELQPQILTMGQATLAVNPSDIEKERVAQFKHLQALSSGGHPFLDENKAREAAIRLLREPSQERVKVLGGRLQCLQALWNNYGCDPVRGGHLRSLSEERLAKLTEVFGGEYFSTPNDKAAYVAALSEMTVEADFASEVSASLTRSEIWKTFVGLQPPPLAGDLDNMREALPKLMLKASPEVQGQAREVVMSLLRSEAFRLNPSAIVARITDLVPGHPPAVGAPAPGPVLTVEQLAEDIRIVGILWRHKRAFHVSPTPPSPGDLQLLASPIVQKTSAELRQAIEPVDHLPITIGDDCELIRRNGLSILRWRPQEGGTRWRRPLIEFHVDVEPYADLVADLKGCYASSSLAGSPFRSRFMERALGGFSLLTFKHVVLKDAAIVENMADGAEISNVTLKGKASLLVQGRRLRVGKLRAYGPSCNIDIRGADVAVRKLTAKGSNVHLEFRGANGILDAKLTGCFVSGDLNHATVSDWTKMKGCSLAWLDMRNAKLDCLEGLERFYDMEERERKALHKRFRNSTVSLDKAGGRLAKHAEEFSSSELDRSYNRAISSFNGDMLWSDLKNAVSALRREGFSISAFDSVPPFDPARLAGTPAAGANVRRFELMANEHTYRVEVPTTLTALDQDRCVLWEDDKKLEAVLPHTASAWIYMKILEAELERKARELGQPQGVLPGVPSSSKMFRPSKVALV